ncbi:MAG: hotdog fold thioesterase [Flavobacteriaceae bacterium]|nr:hotdog fold thioesterase [Flavobacteriaceae bacterium]
MKISREHILQQCNDLRKDTLIETLSIEFVDYGEDSITARMPVNHRVHQPDGVLHGGASVALAETVGSMAAILFTDSAHSAVRGIEISANHLKSIREGFVYATATPIHKGRTTQLWQIRIVDETDRLISLVKLTTISLPKSAQ